VSIDSMPVAWGSLLQVMTIMTIVVVIVHIKTAETLDRIRRHQTGDMMFRARKFLMVIKLVVLCWMVVYGHRRGGEPWPPFVVFLMAYDATLISQIMIMRADVARAHNQRMIGNGHTASG
jgi:hypothetical protein